MRTDPLPGTSNGVVVFSSPLGTTNVTGVPSFRTPSTEFTTRRSCVYLPAGARSRARRRVRFARATKSMFGEARGRWIQPLSFPASARWTWMSENTTFNCFQSAGASWTYTYSVPDVTEPKNANPAMRSKPVTAMANTVRGLGQIHAPRLLQGRDERGRGATRFQQVVAHAAVPGFEGICPAGPSALNFCETSLERHEETSPGTSSFVSSARI